MQPHRLPGGAGGRPGHHRRPEGAGRAARGAPPAGALRGRLPGRRQRVPVLCQEVPVERGRSLVSDQLMLYSSDIKVLRIKIFVGIEILWGICLWKVFKIRFNFTLKQIGIITLLRRK